jgi:hypothetical protein
VAANFPGYGLWLYTDATGWKLLNGVDVSQLVMDAGVGLADVEGGKCLGAGHQLARVRDG